MALTTQAAALWAKTGAYSRAPGVGGGRLASAGLPLSRAERLRVERTTPACAGTTNTTATALVSCQRLTCRNVVRRASAAERVNASTFGVSALPSTSAVAG
jgi:hypothetical protein